MREIRPYGSEGGAARKGCPYPYPGKILYSRPSRLKRAEIHSCADHDARNRALATKRL